MWQIVHLVLLPLVARLQAAADAAPRPDAITAAHRVRAAVAEERHVRVV